MSEPHLIDRDLGYPNCPICFGRGTVMEATDHPSDEGGPQYREVDCYECMSWERINDATIGDDI